ncbi:hypothetical protein GXW74_26670 [Roseomonas eburnea]|uniref:Uncharacterized protein n=1 Tax=Neoroseomonas eburnea TaxID=1346889 RepID=A0A9X9XK41_9PROT|nr:hypothetical protein [Neoroseomonas eburnea]MBR0684077.1 hypothetical protein [Neoroseomonas eburnea]
MPYHEMSADGFEAMTVSLMDKEPGGVSATLYRTQRQLQYGIDVLARRPDGSIEVASCKCYAAVDKGELQEWSDDFLKHWDGHWKDQKVRRFILVVAANVHSAQRDAEVREERERFLAIGVEYEVWAPHQIQEKLRPHPGIVVQHLGPEHLERVCGVVSAPFNMISGAGAVPTGPSAAALDDLRGLISKGVGHRLDHLLGRLRTGEVSATAAALQEIRGGTEWDALEAGTKARVLRLQASILLHAGDDAAASALADEADVLEPQTEPRLRAVLTYRRAGASAALEVLGDPTSQDGAHLRVALLLDQGKVAAAGAVLDDHPAVEADHAETLRLRAFVSLMEDSREAALRFADAAHAAAPGSPATMRVAAIAHYAAALSPAFGPDHTIQPNPVPLDLVREDAASRGHLLCAREILDAMGRKELDASERREAEVLALACLCNLRDRSADAAAHLTRMLAADPAWAAAAHWGLARGLPLDRDALRNALQDRIARGDADPDGILLLTVLEASDGRFGEAIGILEASTAFRTPEALAIRDGWLAKFRRAQPGADEVSDEPDATDLERTVEGARNSGDWSAAEALLGRLAARTGRPDPLLLPLAQALAASARWSAILRHRGALLALGTPEPIRVVVYAAVHGGEPATALDILRLHREVFAGGRLPSDLARLEVEALAGVGDQAGAIRNAVLLASAESSTVEDHLMAVAAHVRAGDVRAAVPFAEAARRSGSLAPLHAIQLAQAISPADQAVASSLLRHALTGPIEPELAPGAISVAFRLGLERQAAPLLAGLMALGDQPGSGVWKFDIEGLGDFLRHQHEAAERLSRMHRSGDVPAHLAADRGGINLARLYLLDDGGRAGRGDYPIFTLHGIRSARNAISPEVGDGPVHVDVTALLIADQLGLMDLLERMAGRILLPPSLPPALLQMEEKLRPHQPARLAAMREVVHLAGATTIGIFRPETTPAGQEHEGLRGDRGMGRWFLDFDRDHADPPGPAPHAGMARLNLRGMTDALLAGGAIGPDVHRTALEGLGRAGGRPAIGAPARHDEVFLADFVAVELAAAGILASAARTFRLLLDDDALQAMRADIARAEEREAHANRVATLRARVARNLVAGTFSTLPATEREEVDEIGPSTRCLLELLRAPGIEGGVTWIDDRHITAHGLCGANRVFDTTAMLEALTGAQWITPAERWTALLRLREANALFVPITAEEVVHHLRAAPILDGEVVETTALATLRRYVAKALAAATDLDVRPVLAGTGPGEVPFLLALRRLAEDTLLAIWTAEEGTVEEREVRSSWVWSSLRVDQFPDVGLPGTAPGCWRALLTLGYAALLANGLHILLQVKGADRKGRLRAYMTWLGGSAVPPWITTDDIFAKDVGGILARMLTGLGDESEGGRKLGREGRKTLQALLGEVVVNVPEPFHDHLLALPALCRAAGIRQSEAIVVGGLRFEPSPFWKAAEAALAGGRASVKTNDGRGTLRLRIRRGRATGLALSGALEGVLDDPALGLLSRDRAVRLRTARTIVDGLGMVPADAAAAVEQLVAAKKMSERMDAAVRLRQASVHAWRRDLQERLRSRANIPWSEFGPPDPGSLLRYVGLLPGSSTPVGGRFADAASRLVGDFGAAEAVRRLASLPIPLPDEVLASVRALPMPERAGLLTDLGGVAATPVQRLHCLRIHRDLRGAGIGDRDAFAEALRALPALWDAHARLFLVVLKQFGEELQPDGPTSRGLSADEAIVASWIHADHVTRAILAAGSEPVESARRFSGRPARREAARAVVFRRGYDDAAAAPGSMTSEGLLFHGLGYALGTEQLREDALPDVRLVDGLRDILSAGAGPRRMPVPWIYADREGAGDDLGTWFRARPSWVFPEEVSVTTEAARISVGSALGDLNMAQTGQARLWLVLSIVARPHLDEERRAIAAKAVSAVDFGALLENDSEIGMVVLRCAAEIAQASGDDAARSSFEEKLASYAEQLAGHRGGRLLPAQEEDVVLNLVEAAAACSRSNSTADGFGRFGCLMVALATAWPGIAPHVRDVVGSLATESHPAMSAPIQDSWLKLRAMN